MSVPTAVALSILKSLVLPLELLYDTLFDVLLIVSGNGDGVVRHSKYTS